MKDKKHVILVYSLFFIFRISFNASVSKISHFLYFSIFNNFLRKMTKKVDLYVKKVYIFI